MKLANVQWYPKLEKESENIKNLWTLKFLLLTSSYILYFFVSSDVMS